MKASIIVHHPQSALDRAETRRGQRPSLYQSQILCDPLWTFLQWRTIMYVSIDQNSGKLSSPPWWRPESNRERRVKAVPALPFPVLGCCKPRLPISQSEHSRSKFLTVSDKLHKLAMLSVAAKGGGTARGIDRPQFLSERTKLRGARDRHPPFVSCGWKHKSFLLPKRTISANIKGWIHFWQWTKSFLGFAFKFCLRRINDRESDGEKD